MVASAEASWPIAMWAAPSASFRQKLLSPSAALTTCWSDPWLEPSAFRNPSSAFMASCAAAAHSSVRNLTAIVRPPRCACDRTARSADLDGILVARGRGPQGREQEVGDVAQEPQATLVAVHLDRVDGGVVRQKEHVLGQPHDVAEVG